ncbi:kinase-like domain-containing protein [Pisolithus croceorrhizus]|nr:kinase-like domain-containing protein [Pisolithus croceorrhizus]
MEQHLPSPHTAYQPEATDAHLCCTGSLSGHPNLVLISTHLFREAHTWSKLRHKNIVPMLGISTELFSTTSIISEWTPLGNAHDYVQNTEHDPRPLVSQRVLSSFAWLDILLQLGDIASRLYYLHSHELGIVHGDQKSVNVLVSNDRRALLADFGFPF